MSDLGKIVSKAAPIVGNILNSVLPGSGFILQGLAGLFGLGSNASQEDIANAIANDPEAYVKLKQFELEHKYDLEALIVQDRNSARVNEAEVAKAQGKRDWVRPFLVISSTVLFASMCYIIAFTHADNTDRDILFAMLGSLQTVWAGSIVGYYFGGFADNKFQLKKNDKEEVELPPPADTH